MQYVSREDFNAMQNAPKAQILARAPILESKCDVAIEQAQDLNINRAGQKPASYKITAEKPLLADRERICLKTYKKLKEEPAPQQRTSLRALTKIKEPDVGLKSTTLGLKNGLCEPSRLQVLQNRKTSHQQELLQFAQTVNTDNLSSSMKRNEHLEFVQPQTEGFTFSKLQEHRRAEARKANEEQRKLFIEQEKPEFAKTNEPFYLNDPALHYGEVKKLSQKQMEIQKKGKIESTMEKVVTYEVSLKKQKENALQKQIENQKITNLENIPKEQMVAPEHGRKQGFSTQVLAQKNPDWALLHIKSIMQQDEDKPLYSCFSPDGYFREMMLPQIRAQPGNARQIPQELRGMVRVLQLPILGEEAQVLDCETERMAGECRVITRPEFFD
ncbi:Conserved_hypothetical protein [Hexamita inflata]|uniref:Uncharacterized protein n=1 Tax=Hexamita inflata TaxID=28002 RepID=A0AA86PG93_9EUKA|nr:Conserved hypothetical protein [Hexamita inflata]